MRMLSCVPDNRYRARNYDKTHIVQGLGSTGR